MGDVGGGPERSPHLSQNPPLIRKAGRAGRRPDDGEILLDARGARPGAVINEACRFQGLTRGSFTPGEGGITLHGISDRNRIFLGGEATPEAQAAGIPLRFLGFCGLKGFSGLHRACGVPWATAR